MTKADAEELRMARWILQKHSTVLIVDGGTVKSVLDAIDRLTEPFPPGRRTVSPNFQSKE